jgi:hypothetical protein
MGVKDMTKGRKQFGCLISAVVAARPPPMTPWKRLFIVPARCTEILTTHTRLKKLFYVEFCQKNAMWFALIRPVYYIFSEGIGKWRGRQNQLIRRLISLFSRGWITR